MSVVPRVISSQPGTAKAEVGIIYIMGYGRSGSTFLDILLNGHPAIASAGALSNYLDWIAEDAPCACGSAISQCELWASVARRLGSKQEEIAGLKTLQLAVESRKNVHALLRGKLPEHLTSKYGLFMRRLFTSIAGITGTDAVVDSSKSAAETLGRAYALSKYTGFEVKVIHLVRDGRGVVWSAMRGPGSPERAQTRSAHLRALKAMIGWIATNALCLYVAGRLKSEEVLRLRYEDLAVRPDKELRRIGDFLDLDMANVVKMIETNSPFSVGHNLGGNRLRFSRHVVLNPDFEWMRQLPLIYRIAFRFLAWPLTTKFGY